MLFGRVATGASEILALHGHVHIQGTVRLENGGIEVSVLHALSPATEEMAGAAILPRRSSDAMGHLVPFRRVVGLVLHRKQGRFGHGIPCHGRELLISPGLLMADEAVDLFLGGKIEAFVFPPIPRMARGTPRLFEWMETQ